MRWFYLTFPWCIFEKLQFAKDFSFSLRHSSFWSPCPNTSSKLDTPWCWAYLLFSEGLIHFWKEKIVNSKSFFWIQCAGTKIGYFSVLGWNFFPYHKKMPYMNGAKQKIIVLCRIKLITNLSKVGTWILEISRKTVDELAKALEKLDKCGAQIIFWWLRFSIHARHQGQRGLFNRFFCRIRGLLLGAEATSFLKRISEAYKLLFN